MQSHFCETVHLETWQKNLSESSLLVFSILPLYFYGFDPVRICENKNISEASDHRLLQVFCCLDLMLEHGFYFDLVKLLVWRRLEFIRQHPECIQKVLFYFQIIIGQRLVTMVRQFGLIDAVIQIHHSVSWGVDDQEILGGDLEERITVHHWEHISGQHQVNVNMS